MFILPHRVESEIGPFGAFFVFGLVFSAMYLVNFFAITAPMYLISVRTGRDRLSAVVFNTSAAQGFTF